MLTSLCDIILLALHFLCGLWLAFCYIRLVICLFCCILSLLNFTELPFLVAWLVYGFAGYLVTYLQWTGGLVGWLPIWLTGCAVAVLHTVANIGCFPSGWSEHLI